MVDAENTLKLGQSGHTLTLEERSGLQVAIIQRQKEENFPAKPLFWGKILGEQNDYILVYALQNETEFPTKKFYYLTTGTYVLKQLPELSAEYEAKAKALNSRFKGDPSYPLEGSPEESENAEEQGGAAAKTERFREIHRLAYVVKLIDHDVGIVPRGSMYLDATHKVRSNKTYEGLSYASAENLKSYLHFRKPESAYARVTFEKEGIARAGDFLDNIDDDKPQGIWAVTWDPSHTMVNLRSLYWPGYFFYHAIGTPDYAGVYFGWGTKNADIAFQL